MEFNYAHTLATACYVLPTTDSISDLVHTAERTSFLVFQIIVDANEGVERTALLPVVPSHADALPFTGCKISVVHASPNLSPSLSYRQSRSPTLLSQRTCDVNSERPLLR